MQSTEIHLTHQSEIVPFEIMVWGLLYFTAVSEKKTRHTCYQFHHGPETAQVQASVALNCKR